MNLPFLSDRKRRDRSASGAPDAALTAVPTPTDAAPSAVGALDRLRQAREGAPAPALTLSGVYGETMTLEALQAGGRPVLLVAVDPTHPTGSDLLPLIAQWQDDHADRVAVAVLSRASAAESRDLAARHGLFNVLLAEDDAVGRAPFALLVDGTGVVAGPPAVGAEAIRALVVGLDAAKPPAPAARPAPAPAAPEPPAEPEGVRDWSLLTGIELTELTGKRTKLPASGKPTVLVFWNPDEPFCQDMLPDLKRWDAKRPDGGPRVILLGISTAQANRAMGLKTRTLLDPAFLVGHAIGVKGLPAAVRFDAAGTMVGGVEYGPRAMLALMNGQEPADAPANGTERIGTPAPAFALPDLDGRRVHLGDQKGRPTLLLFWDPGCGYCRGMLDRLKAWEASPSADAPRLLVVATGSPEANRALGLASPVLLDPDSRVRRSFRTYGTPTAVLVDANGRVASPIAEGAAQVMALATGQPIAEAVDNPAALPPAPTVGDAAPAFLVPSLDGDPVSSEQFRGHETALLFWNPGCGFCQRLLPQVRQWEAARPDGAPQLVVVTTGSAEENRGQGFASPVLLPGSPDLMFAFGGQGTPSAILIDAEGKIASRLAVGGPPVIDLLNGKLPTDAPAAAPRRGTPGIGDPAPAVDLPTLDGGSAGLEAFRGRKTALLFWNPGCGFCQRLLPDLRAWEDTASPDAPRLAVVTVGDPDAVRAHGFASTVLLAPGFETMHGFGAQGTPTAVLLDEDGRIASNPAVGGPAVLGLLNGQLPEARPQAPAEPPRKVPRLGEPAPEVDLPDLVGRQVDLANLHGLKKAVLFWNPGCGFCQRLLPDLKRWEKHKPADAPKLVIVSAGDAEATAAHRFRSMTLLAGGSETMFAFGVRGTPTAVLVDEQGRIASAPAVGGEAVLNLLNGTAPEPSA